MVHANAVRHEITDEHPRGFVFGEASGGWANEDDLMEEELVAPESDEEEGWGQSAGVGADVPEPVNVVALPSTVVRGGACDMDIDGRFLWSPVWRSRSWVVTGLNCESMCVDALVSAVYVL